MKKSKDPYKGVKGTKELFDLLIKHLAQTGVIDIPAWELFIEEELSGNKPQKIFPFKKKKAA
ncbi:hypothetical protein ACFLRA_03570 [Bdellovibrionota bacterium]